MGAMVPSPAPAPRGLSRRAFLAATGGLAMLAAGCTGGSPDDAAVSTEEADQLAGQVAVQAAVVAAYAAATTADAELGAAVTEQARQAGEQLDRLRAAAPSAASSSPPASAPPGAPPAGADVRGWLRDQVAAAAGAHATACVDQTGPRAALLGSLAAGLRGQEAALA
jgi:hypothetical protein